MVKVALNTRMGSRMLKISFFNPALCSSERTFVFRASQPRASINTTGMIALTASIAFFPHFIIDTHGLYHETMGKTILHPIETHADLC